MYSEKEALHMGTHYAFFFLFHFALSCFASRPCAMPLCAPIFLTFTTLCCPSPELIFTSFCARPRLSTP